LTRGYQAFSGPAKPFTNVTELAEIDKKSHNTPHKLLMLILITSSRSW